MGRESSKDVETVKSTKRQEKVNYSHYKAFCREMGRLPSRQGKRLERLRKETDLAFIVVRGSNAWDVCAMNFPLAPKEGAHRLRYQLVQL